MVRSRKLTGGFKAQASTGASMCLGRPEVSGACPVLAAYFVCGHTEGKMRFATPSFCTRQRKLQTLLTCISTFMSRELQRYYL